MTGDGLDGRAVPRHPDLRRLLEYWDTRRGDRAFPRRGDIDPVDFSFMLDRVALTEVHEGERRFRLRLVGSWWSRMVGFEPTGMWMEDWPHAGQRQISIEGYERVIAARQPQVAVRDAWVDNRRLDYEIMHLPLSEDGTRVSMIVTAIGPS